MGSPHSLREALLQGPHWPAACPGHCQPSGLQAWQGLWTDTWPCLVPWPLPRAIWASLSCWRFTAGKS